MECMEMHLSETPKSPELLCQTVCSELRPFSAEYTSDFDIHHCRNCVGLIDIPPQSTKIMHQASRVKKYNDSILQAPPMEWKN